MKSKVLQQILDDTPPEVTIYVNLYAALVLRINEVLKEKGINQKMLAERLDKRPSEISKWLSGDHNFTLWSIAKLQAELGEDLLQVPQQSRVLEYKGERVLRNYTIVPVAPAPGTNCHPMLWQPIAKTQKPNERYANAG